MPKQTDERVTLIEHQPVAAPDRRIWGVEDLFTGRSIVWFRCPVNRELQFDMKPTPDPKLAMGVLCAHCDAFHEVAISEGGVPEGPTIQAEFRRDEPINGQPAFTISVRPQPPRAD